MNPNPPLPRRIKWIQPHFQGKLIAAFGGLMLLALAVQSLLFAPELARVAAGASAGDMIIAKELLRRVAVTFILSLGLAMPLIFGAGVVLTFKIAGPLYRLERHLKAVADGEHPDPCRLRQGDELHELCTLINEALEAARREVPATEVAIDGQAA